MHHSISHQLQIVTKIIQSAMHDWGSLHPLVIHFPIGLLFVAPLFIVYGVLTQKTERTFYACGLFLMILGTATIFLSTFTGNHAAEELNIGSQTLKTLTAHVELAEKTRLHFTILSSIFFVYCLVFPKLIRKFNATLHTILTILFLIVYAFNLLLLSNAAHYGGQLVHEHGLKSSLFSEKEIQTP